MSRKVQKFPIGGEVYEITQLGTEIGMPLGHRLMKALAPSVRAFVAQIAASDEKTLDAAIEKIGELGIALQLIDAFEHAPTELLIEFGATFREHTKVKSSTLWLPLADLYDDHFAGRYDLWVKWVLACVKLNFGARFLGSGSGSGASPNPASGSATTESP